jgi:D-amino-acid oxidase
MRVLVVGAGVTGLSVGVRLAEAGYDAHVLARELPLETTSSVAAAIWYPYLARPFDRVLGWSEVALQEFRRLAEEADSDEIGIVMREGVELVGARSDDPWWTSAVPDWKRLDFAPPPYRDGWTFTTPVIEMPVYLSWLHRRFEAAGGTITRMALSSLPNHADLVVNCSGLGARRLGDDDELEPVRGQVVRLGQIGLTRWLLAEEGPTYVVPRSADIVVGGTEEHGAWDRRPSPEVAEQILSRATALVPELAEAEVLGHRVGLRPARPTVRLEPEKLPTGHRVIHCYGHGGAGVTISWGCADEVLAMVQAESPG